MGRARRLVPAACACLAAALNTAPLSAQGLSRADRERGHAMLKVVGAEIQRHYYDPAIRNVDLAARTAELDARIQAATSLGEMLSAVAVLALELGDSHTFFVPPAQTVRVDYGWEMWMVGESAYVGRVMPTSDAAAKGLAPGDRLLGVNGQMPTRANLFQLLYLYHFLRPQRLLQVEIESPDGVRRNLGLAAEVREAFRIADLTGSDGGGDIARLIREAQNEERELQSVIVEIGPDILLWRFPTFDAPASVIREVFRDVRERKALVIDVRGNAGGPVKTLLEVIGRLSTDDVMIGVQRTRSGEVPLVAEGARKNAFHGKVIVLVDSRSASSSEILARAVQLSGRGTVVGDRTAGAVSRSRYRVHQLGMDTAILFGVSVTDAELVMSDGSRLEGAGVVPDAVVLPSPRDMARGHDPALSHALGLAGVSIEPDRAGAVYEKK